MDQPSLPFTITHPTGEPGPVVLSSPHSGRVYPRAILDRLQVDGTTLLALDYELNDYNPANTMRLQQAEEFVHVIYRATGRFPVVYTHANWANGTRARRGLVSEPVGPNSILAQCDLWIADHREHAARL